MHRHLRTFFLRSTFFKWRFIFLTACNKLPGYHWWARVSALTPLLLTLNVLSQKSRCGGGACWVIQSNAKRIQSPLKFECTVSNVASACISDSPFRKDKLTYFPETDSVFQSYIFLHFSTHKEFQLFSQVANNLSLSHFNEIFCYLV